MITVEFPTLLRQFISGQDTIIINTTEPLSLIDVIKHLIDNHPKLRPYLIESNESLPHFVAYYINQQEAHSQQGALTAVNPSSTVRIVLAIAGG